MSGSRSFSWVGTISEDWNTPANWADATTGQTPAVVVPGSQDVVIVNNGTLSGGGHAASLTFVGTDALLGDLNIGTLAVGGWGYSGNTLEINAGATVSATAATDAGNLVDNGFIASGDLLLGQPVAYAGGHGSSSYSGAEFASSLSGTGTIEVQTGGLIVLQEPVTTPGLTFQLDGTTSLYIEASICAGNTIDLGGNADTLVISDQWYLEEHPAEFAGQQPYFTGGPPVVDTTINGFNNSDTLVFVDDIFLGTAITSVGYAGGVLSLLNGSTVVSTFALAGNYSNKTFSVGTPTSSWFVGQTQQAITVACFAVGTQIGTPSGAIPIERLHVGDTVMTICGQPNPIKWIGWRSIDCRTHPTPHHVWPVRVRRDAFAPGVPFRDLFLSPDHAVFAEGVLIPIKYLVNQRTIQQVPYNSVEYFHLELPEHNILLANGLPVESYLDTGDRGTFANGGRAVTMFPDFWLCALEALGYAPLVVTGRQVEAVRQRVEVQARHLRPSSRRQCPGGQADPCHRRQLCDAQASQGATVARPTSALDIPLHANLRLMAERGRGLLCQTHQAAAQTRRVPFDRRAPDL